MLKLYREQTKTLYEIQKDLKLSQVRLYKYARGERKIENMPSKLMLELAKYLKININDLSKKMIEYQKEREMNRK